MMRKPIQPYVLFFVAGMIALTCATPAPACAKSGSASRCCPANAHPQECQMACHGSAGQVSATPPAQASTIASPAASSGQFAATTLPLAAAAPPAARRSLHAPPLERYLLACVLRL